VTRSEGARLPEYAERVLELVDTIPPGTVLSYGDVAELVGSGGPRQVGQVMASYGSLTHWWRVVFADGSLPTCNDGVAQQFLRAEGVPLRGHRVVMSAARWSGPPARAVGSS
jgi:alkylated DNA nucleotide flippase Atl1